MRGGLKMWTGILVLASWMACGVQAEGESIVITSMEWKISETIDLTACAEAELATGDLVLIVKSSSQGLVDFIGTPNNGNTSCADFSDEALKVPDESTIFELLVVEPESRAAVQRGYVSYFLTVSQTLITCDEDGTQFVRVKTSNGTFTGGTCFPGAVSDPLVCYKSAADTRVCVTGLDESSPDLQVCVDQTAEVNAPVCEQDELITRVSLNYEEESLTFEGGGDGSLRELLYNSSSAPTVAVTACDSNRCLLESFAPSSDSYSLCAVYLGNNDGVNDVCHTQIQDLDLTVVATDPIVDFYIINVFDESEYEVYSGDDAGTILETITTTLDCSAIPPESPCYGFITDTSIGYVAVSSTDQTNVIISNTTVSFTRDAKALV